MAKSMREQGYNTSKIQREVLKTLRADADYKRAVAENTKAYKHEINKIIKETVRDAGLAGDKLVGSAGLMAWNDDLRIWKEQNIDLEKPNNLNQLYQAFKKQTKQQLRNITQTTGFKGTILGTTGVLDMYQRSMDLAVLKLSTGTFSYDQCVKDLVHQLSQSGLRSIDYSNGRSYHIDTAARMVVRTASSQLAGKITEMNIEKTGVDLVYVDAHAGSRPSHAVWQGAVYSYSGKNQKYPDFFRSTDYGDVTGLNGVNCTHNFYPYWEGSPIPEFNEPDPVMINGQEYTYYEATQEQRKMERGIRATKREIEGLEAVGYDTTALNKKLNLQLKEYKQFSSAVELKPKNNRLNVFIGDMSRNKDVKITKSTIKGTYPTSNEIINDILNKELKNVRFSTDILYNSRIRTPGATTYTYRGYGPLIIKKIEIGKQYNPNREEVIDTILHEELEARILIKSYNSEFYNKLNTMSDDERHNYINKVIKVAFRMKGFDYGLVSN